jgi:hypothetical protein
MLNVRALSIHEAKSPKQRFSFFPQRGQAKLPVCLSVENVTDFWRKQKSIIKLSKINKLSN